MIKKKFLLWMKKGPEIKQDIQAGLVSIGAYDIPAHYNFKHGSDMYGRIIAENQSAVSVKNNQRYYR